MSVPEICPMSVRKYSESDEAAKAVAQFGRSPHRTGAAGSPSSLVTEFRCRLSLGGTTMVIKSIEQDSVTFQQEGMGGGRKTITLYEVDGMISGNKWYSPPSRGKSALRMATRPRVPGRHPYRGVARWAPS